jgi:hypothetical protein
VAQISEKDGRGTTAARFEAYSSIGLPEHSTSMSLIRYSSLNDESVLENCGENDEVSHKSPRFSVGSTIGTVFAMRPLSPPWSYSRRQAQSHLLDLASNYR